MFFFAVIKCRFQFLFGKKAGNLEKLDTLAAVEAVICLRKGIKFLISCVNKERELLKFQLPKPTFCW